jgi:branched-chain amino acid transport system ATP-binding protein
MTANPSPDPAAGAPVAGAGVAAAALAGSAVAGAAADQPLLAVTDLVAGYGRIDVLRDVALSIRPGEIVTVVGPNGAGKTTLLKTISGVIRRRSGHIAFAGQEVGQLPAHALVRRGITYVPEGREVFGQLTVEENLWLGAFTHQARRAHMREVVLGIFPRLAERLSQRAGSLSGGEQQMLAIARGLMSEPKLLLIDEPTLGLAPVLVEGLAEWLGQARSELGTTLLLAEQSAKLATGLSDRMYVLVGGRVRAEAGAAGIDDEELFRLYMGDRAGDLS